MDFVTKPETIKLLTAYGEASQRTHAIQELAELQQEITKRILGNSKRENYIAEIADVYNMLDEIRHIEGFTMEEIRQIAREKMEKALNKASEVTNERE